MRYPQTIDRPVHPEAARALTAEEIAAFLDVARDLRNGTIPPENYDQTLFCCGTVHCIAGWLYERLNKKLRNEIQGAVSVWPFLRENPLPMLFAAAPLGIAASGRIIRPTPAHAADAIERLIFEWPDDPWKTEDKL